MTAICQMMPSPFPVARKVEVPGNNAAYGPQVMAFQRLPSEPVGSATLTLTNVIVGSRILIRDQLDTTTFYDQIAAGTTVVISLNVFSPGSSLNDWLIKIRKASATPFYRPYRTIMTATVGASSIYVDQIPD